jgi:hypothetical protein
MARQTSLAEAVQVAIVASAHATAYERISAAAEACQRLGTLSSGRWRSATRDLERMEEDLERALDHVSEDVARRASSLGVPEEALWTMGDAADLLDALRDDAVDMLGDDGNAGRLLGSDLLFGVTFMEDSEAPNRGRTLMFSWPEPLQPAVWPWEANWVVGEEEAEAEERESEAEEREEELEIFQAGDLQVSETLLAKVCEALGVESDAAMDALGTVAEALTRTSLETALGEPGELGEEGNLESTNGQS